MKRLRIVIASLLAVVFWVSTPAAERSEGNLIRKLADGKIKPGKIVVISGATIVTKTAPFISSGTLAAARAAIEADEERKEAADFTMPADLPFPDLGESPNAIGCGDRAGHGHGDFHSDEDDHDGHRNIRVNQDCGFRRQAETGISFNPVKPENLLAGMNDSRVGFNQCGIAFSTDNGKHWGDMLPPFRQKVNYPAFEEPTTADPNRHTILGGAGTFHTYDAASDPAVAFDSSGRGFFSCVAFDVFSDASLVSVMQSPRGAQGSFFFTIATFGRNFVVAEDNNPEVFHDKEFIAADAFPNSPNRDNVYVTWTALRFSPTCGPQPNPDAEEQYCSSPIFGSMSTDHGLTWSTPEEISGASSICFFGNFFDPTRAANACDFNQGSDPAVLPNGRVVVTFNNGNTAATNPNGQQLAVVCQPAGSSPAGTAHMNCASPTKVGDDVVVGEPQCDFGRGPEECIPGAYIRTNDFPRIAVNRDNGHLFVTWQDYRNGEFDIQLAQSLDGGGTWSQIGTINPDRGLDHYFPAVALVERPDRDRVGISYYRTERVPNENVTPAGGFAPGAPGVQTGDSDYVVAGGSTPAPYSFTVVSPVFPPPDGIQAGFNGDYSGLTINRDEQTHPIWSDTRNVDPYTPANGVVHDEDVYTDKVALPSGPAKITVGHIGKP